MTATLAPSGAPPPGVRLRVPLALAGMLLAGAIGIVGVVLALTQDEREAALFYALGAAILFCVHRADAAVIPAAPTREERDSEA